MRFGSSTGQSGSTPCQSGTEYRLEFRMALIWLDVIICDRKLALPGQNPLPAFPALPYLGPRTTVSLTSPLWANSERSFFSPTRGSNSVMTLFLSPVTSRPLTGCQSTPLQSALAQQARSKNGKLRS